MRQILSLTRKELDSYFGSPMALIFLGAFLAATLFAFFWVDTFFARGIADVRPLFRWMPLLLIFLLAALTMRQWSEEQRSGTLEMLLTLPATTGQLVLGKFLAVMLLVALALLLTLPLPITVSQLGNLDWGPVLSGYLAALLLAAAYAAMGLFVSSRTDNQIVALLLTILLGGVFYLIGTDGLADFANRDIAQILRAFGTGSRFSSIERGVLDLRDLLYYLSLTGIFLMLNVLSLQSLRWSQGERSRPFRRRESLVSGLVIANLLLVNAWLYPIYGLRADTTAAREYTLSATTKNLLANLQEPLQLRAYISKKTHPLLAPLAPQIEDMLQEYALAGRGLVTADVVDPTGDADLENEANQTYGIQPTPFQVSGRYEASVINSYFDILVRYGNQHVVLNFGDLIDVKPNRDGTIDVSLRNLEYDLTRSVKKVVYGFQSLDTLLASLTTPIKLTLVVSQKTLPPDLASVPDTIEKVAKAMQEKAGDKFVYTVVDPDAPDATISRQQLADSYGLQPFAVSIFSPDTFYLDMVLEMEGKTQVIYPGADMSEATIRSDIEAVIKRNSSGFLRAIGLWTPQGRQNTTDMFGQPQQSISGWQMLSQQLSNDYQVESIDLTNGHVPDSIDALVLVGPEQMSDKEIYAVDQYLMRGGSVMIAAGNYRVAPDPASGGLGLTPVDGGLREMLASYGIDIQQSLVLDPQNASFPVTVSRAVGGFSVRDIQALNYPFFVDVRPDGMDHTHPATANLTAVTMAFASPVALDEAKNAGRSTSVLLHSSADAWLRTDQNIQPDMQTYPDLGFPVEGEQKSYPLAVSVQGTFQSFFKGKPSPWQAAADNSPTENSTLAAPTPTPAPGDTQPVGLVEESPDSARLIVFGSSEFVDDAILQLSQALSADSYLNNLMLAQNGVDWAVEDLDLLSIRARGDSTRLLKPLSQGEESTWEIMNYLFALLSLLVVAGVWRWRRSRETPMVLAPTLTPHPEPGD
ncbi:MAG: Gldg family protein [Caldilineaceae bacterium]